MPRNNTEGVQAVGGSLQASFSCVPAGEACMNTLSVVDWFVCLGLSNLLVQPPGTLCALVSLSWNGTLEPSWKPLGTPQIGFGTRVRCLCMSQLFRLAVDRPPRRTPPHPCICFSLSTFESRTNVYNVHAAWETVDSKNIAAVFWWYLVGLGRHDTDSILTRNSL